MGGKARVRTYTNQRRSLEGADFVVCCFQVGGYEPCTVTDFEVPKAYGLRQIIADTLGIVGIMRGLRTVPVLWSICEDLLEVSPGAIVMQYVNPMAINTWAIAAKYPTIRQVGLCHSVQGTAWELARDLEIPVEDIRYRAGGINHMAFYLTFEHRQPDGSYRDLYPALKQGYRDGRFPKPSHWNPRCPNKVRYEMLMRLGYFVTESPSISPNTRPGSSRRPPGPDREIRHPAGRISQTLCRAGGALDKRGRDAEIRRQNGTEGVP